MAYDTIIDRSGASALIPEEYSREILEMVAEGSVFMRTAKRLANMSSNQFRMPVNSLRAYAYFVSPSDIGLKQTTNSAWDNKYINAEEIAAIVPIPKSVLDDAKYDIWASVKMQLAEALGIVVDKAVFFGTDKPASWPTNLATGAVAAGNYVVQGTGADLYADLMEENGVISKLEEDGFIPTGHIAAIKMKGLYRGARDANGNLIFKTSVQSATSYELDGAPIDFPKNGSMVPTEVLQFSGDWTKVVYSIRQDITYTISEDAVITDNLGAIKYNLFQQDMVALRAVMRIGWEVPNPVNRLQPTEADRYPVSVYLPVGSTYIP